MLASASSSFLLSKAARHLITPSLRRLTRVPAVENPLRTFRTIPVFPISSSSGMEQQVASHPAAARAGFSASSAGGSVLTFQFSPLSVLKIQKGDITLWSVDGSTDAIVNAANKQLLGGGGVDGAIHRAAGPELLDACRKVPEVRRGVRCPTGEARITPAFRLPVFYVIHTVGPIYDEDEHPEVSLSNAFRNSLKLAKENNIQYIAFPAISCGVYRYPFKEASRIAISVLKEFPDTFKEIHFVLFSDELYGVWLQTASEETELQLLA
ncbi:macro domain-containing protein VPA0103-like [Zingiber officinale]|uniref:macro domain-containing protein VPA0103-like n=1 Tax=Zingiber officinale TaxID=94328 RepID=UPI001C4B59B4|nr:macro domain-containing protein VPA0103-like [Zingiber officinale]XP_042459149.1 macro domain-containing protein VPA0103-like [Zingiber officinale]